MKKFIKFLIILIMTFAICLPVYACSLWPKKTPSEADGEQTEPSAPDGQTPSSPSSPNEGQTPSASDEQTPPSLPSTYMQPQKYDEATFDYSTLQEHLLDYEGMIGLPATGTYNALVVPVEFRGDEITRDEIEKLRIAFNGTEEQTGWESVSTYYKKASYGKLNLTFDVQKTPYTTKYPASYYRTYSSKYMQDGEQINIKGTDIILEEVLASLAPEMDLSEYDTNGDGYIDAVYLMYSSPIDYQSAGFFWAYVTWYPGRNTYDNLNSYYYFFAGIDFADEDVGVLPNIKVNASTYIHETGHLFGLDDYYDYDDEEGCGEGLGGADMMDYTVGDQNVYSKTILGWLKPKIITSTQTVAIKSSVNSPDAILIPLDFDNSYFCEYLMIDLYERSGLNSFHASFKDTLLYDGCDTGVRIYHVSSSIDSPFSNIYDSFTDYNNSITDISLIKLVEADGQKNFGEDGHATENDLWQAGDKLSLVFPKYSRNDGKLLNFDISIDDISNGEATITITYLT